MVIDDHLPEHLLVEVDYHLVVSDVAEGVGIAVEVLFVFSCANLNVLDMARRYC